MGQKANPIGLRVAVNKDWRSKWYAQKKDFGRLLAEDRIIREILKKKLEMASVPKILIERAANRCRITILTARPGVVIGRKGAEIDRMKARLEDLTGRRTEVKIVEINNPFRTAFLVAEDIAQQLSKRGSFRRAIKKTLDQVMESGVFGVKVQLSGRLGGAEMSRCEKASRGSIPLSTLQRHIDYGFTIAKTTMGVIGVKVWIDLGDYNSEEADNGPNAQAGQAPKGPKRSHKR